MTSDSASTMPISEVVIAWRMSNWRKETATKPTTNSTPTPSSGWRTWGALGSLPARSAPRVGSVSPRTIIVTAMTRNGTISRLPRGSQSVAGWVLRYCTSWSSIPMASAARRGDEEGGEPGDERGGERRDDEQGEVHRAERRDRRGEDADESGEDHRQHPVDAGEEVGGVAEQRGALLVLRRRRRRQPELRRLVQQRQQQGEDDHDRGEQQPIPRHDDAGELEPRRRQDRPDVAALRAEAQRRRGLEHEHDADGSHHLGQRRRVEHRTEHQEVHEQPDDDGDQQGDHQRRRERHRRSEVEERRQIGQVEITAEEPVHHPLDECQGVGQRQQR